MKYVLLSEGRDQTFIEGIEVVGVYTTLDTAKEAALSDARRYTGSMMDLGWNDDCTPRYECVSFADDIMYAIAETEE